MIFWLLTTEVLSLKGELEVGQFNEIADLLKYRNIEKKEEKAEEPTYPTVDDNNDEDREDDGEEKFLEDDEVAA